MRFDLTALRVFLHACEAGSMTEAARRAHLTLAAVSARIRALEESTGVPLLQRHARGVRATEAGEALARHARVLFQQLQALQEELANPTAQPHTTILLANTSALTRPLGAMLAPALQAFPDARLSVRESASEVTVHALRQGAADVGIVSDAVAVEGLAVDDLGPDPLVLVLPPGHPLAMGEARRFEELMPYPWVGWGEGRALHTHLAFQATRAGAAIRHAVTIPAASSVLDLIAAGVGIGVLPLALVQKASVGSAIAVQTLAEPWARRRLLLCRRPGDMNEAASALVQALRTRWPDQLTPACHPAAAG